MSFVCYFVKFITAYISHTKQGWDGKEETHVKGSTETQKSKIEEEDS